MELKILSKDEFKNRIDTFVELFNSCFSAKTTKEMLIQRFLKNPFDDLLVAVAIDNEKIVANFSAIPLRVMHNEKEYRVAMAINLMTHPNYEGQGLFSKLSNILINHLVMKKYSFILCFPNHLSNCILVNRLGWKDIYEIPTLEFSINSYEYKNTNFVLSKYSDFNFQKFCKNKYYYIKNVEYLKWRYFDVPNQKYYFASNENGSWVIYKKYNDEINIIDKDVKIEDLENMYNYISNIAINMDCKKITAWSQVNTNEHLFFENKGFINHYPIRYFSIYSIINNEDVYNYSNWIINMGDDNVY